MPMLIRSLCTRTRSGLRAHTRYRLATTATGRIPALAAITHPRCTLVPSSAASRQARRSPVRSTGSRLTSMLRPTVRHPPLALQLHPSRRVRRSRSRRTRSPLPPITRTGQRQSTRTMPTRRMRTKSRSQSTRFWRFRTFLDDGGRRGNRMERRVLHHQIT